LHGFHPSTPGRADGGPPHAMTGHAADLQNRGMACSGRVMLSMGEMDDVGALIFV